MAPYSAAEDGKDVVPCHIAVSDGGVAPWPATGAGGGVLPCHSAGIGEGVTFHVSGRGRVSPCQVVVSLSSLHGARGCAVSCHSARDEMGDVWAPGADVGLALFCLSDNHWSGLDDRELPCC